MDREIKFRGKRLDNGEWVYGAYVKCGNWNHIFTQDKTGVLDAYRVDPATVAYSIGKCDKNGNEVYSDHILRYAETIFADCSETEVEEVREPVLIRIINYRPLVSVIKPISKGVRAHGWDQETGEGIILGDIRSEDIEIVGSIYDNPELLEGSL